MGHESTEAILITGGAGFVGCNFIRNWLANEAGTVINLDKLTYAGSLANLADLKDDSRHVFVRGDICDAALVDSLLDKYRPWAIVHFAAESHVDRRSMETGNRYATGSMSEVAPRVCLSLRNQAFGGSCLQRLWASQ